MSMKVFLSLFDLNQRFFYIHIQKKMTLVERRKEFFNVFKNKMKHEDYRKTPFEKNQMRHKMLKIQSKCNQLRS